MTTLPLRNSVNHAPLRRGLFLITLAPVLVVVVALAISAQLSTQDQHGSAFIEFNVPGFQDTSPRTSTRGGRLWEGRAPRSIQVPVSCALPTAPSPRSRLRVVCSPPLLAPTLREQLRDPTRMRAVCFTASCALPAVPSLPSTRPATGQTPRLVAPPKASIVRIGNA